MNFSCASQRHQHDPQPAGGGTEQGATPPRPDSLRSPGLPSVAPWSANNKEGENKTNEAPSQTTPPGRHRAGIRVSPDCGNLGVP